MLAQVSFGLRSPVHPTDSAPTPTLFGGTSHNGRETLDPSGRLVGRQRPEADEVSGGEEQQRPGCGRSHNKPPTGDSLREFVLHSLNAKGTRPAHETFPAGTSSPAGRYVQCPLPLRTLGASLSLSNSLKRMPFAHAARHPSHRLPVNTNPPPSSPARLSSDDPHTRSSQASAPRARQ